MQVKKVRLSGLLLGVVTAYPVFATNGMNLEGYGPIATAMGGASMALENGTAAVMNNPATLGLMPKMHRLDVAVGVLGPDISAEAGGMTAESSSTAFFMPALGWVQKTGAVTYGFGIFAQGGMGTEYAADSFMGNPGQQATSPALENRSEVGVGRAILPISVDVNDQLTFAASLDFVWAGMDLKMAMNEAQFQNLANPGAQTIGNASGTLVNAFGAMYEPFGGSGINNLHYAYFDFSNDNDFTGEAFATGIAGKLGVMMKLTPKVTFGATYHTKTSLKDLETSNATMTMAVNGDTGALSTGTPSGTDADITIPVTGKITVNNFEWPALIGAGVAVQATDKLLVAADFKSIGWADVMQEFSMSFEADSSASNGGFGGKKMDMALYQNWKNQAVVSVGGAYKATDEFTVRLGYNHASNPVPAAYLNALFPAIVESHIAAGVGYKFATTSSVNFSFTKAMEIDVTNPGSGIKSTHSQANWQLMYSLLY